MSDPIPVVLFAYARPAHLARTLSCLRENHVPLILAFADGAKGERDATAVAEVRAQLHAITWGECRVVERTENFGLGRNVLAAIGEVAERHHAFIGWEDDLSCVPGTYAWMTAALERYRDDERVMSVSGWTHPRVTPPGLGAEPYFDGRAESWSWGAWARSWRGMAGETAEQKLAALARRGISAGVCGGDLAGQAHEEAAKNLWAARWLLHHLQHDGLCVRPPWSMVDHAGFDAAATNAPAAAGWDQPALRPAPPVPATWPVPREHPACRRLWRAAYPAGWRKLWQRALARMKPRAP